MKSNKKPILDFDESGLDKLKSFNVDIHSSRKLTKKQYIEALVNRRQKINNNEIKNNEIK